MKKIKSLFFAVFVFTFIVIPVKASVASTFNVKLMGIGNSQVRYGSYSGLYKLKIDGSNIINAMCDDKLTNVNIGDTWKANRFSYSQIQAGAHVKFASLGIKKYNQAGYLFSLLNSVSISNQADINLAVWDIMSPGSTTLTSSAHIFYDMATSGVYDNFNFSGIMDVITPDPLNASQEYLVSPVPIPASLWLFISSLIVMAGVTHKKRIIT